MGLGTYNRKAKRQINLRIDRQTMGQTYIDWPLDLQILILDNLILWERERQNGKEIDGQIDKEIKKHRQ
jgi:hypothetical protein